MCGSDSVAGMVNLARYPIADADTADAAAFARQCREQYLADGLCVLPGFIRPAALEQLAAEANQVAGDAFFCKSTHNAYLSEDAAQHQEHTFVGSVAYDQIAADAGLRRLYQWDPLMRFIATVLGKSRLYRFADPLGACSINVFVNGGEHGWHFDESEFTITLMLQPPRAGGAFEFVPRIRGTDDEKAIVDGVLRGDRQAVQELPFTSGTLLIFGGRQTLHRVTRVVGEQPRLVPVLCFSEQPGSVNSDTVRRLFWGRTGTRAQART